MIKTYETIRKLRETNSRNEKEQILRDNDTYELRAVLWLTYNYSLNYYLRDLDQLDKIWTKIKLEMYNDSDATELDFIFEVLSILNARELTGHKALHLVKGLQEKISDEAWEVFELIINRDIESGVGIKTINKVYADLIPVFNVMLAEKLDIEDLGDDKFYYIEEKMDGVRFEAIVEGKACTLYTRNGNVANIPTLEKELVDFASYEEEPVVLSLEIIGEDRKSVSGTINKFLKGTNKKSDEEGLIAYIFDITYLDEFERDQCGAPLSARASRIDQMFDGWESPVVKPVVRYEYRGGGNLSDFIMGIFDRVIEEGGEGVMVKPMDGKYVKRRSPNWLKLKEFKTADLRITGFTEGHGKREGKIGAIECTTEDGQLEVSVGTGLSDEDIDFFAENQEALIGSIIEVKYNAIIDDKNSDVKSLFIPVYVKLREDKEEANHLEELL